MRGRTVRTAKKRSEFLKRLADGASVGDAAAAIGAARATMYDWRADDPGFRQAWDDAAECATEIVENQLYNQARDGNLLACIFWLKAHKPSVYNREMQVAIGGDPDAPSVTTATVTGAWIYPREELRRLAIIEAEADEPTTDVGEEEAA